MEKTTISPLLRLIAPRPLISPKRVPLRLSRPPCPRYSRLATAGDGCRVTAPVAVDLAIRISLMAVLCPQKLAGIAVETGAKKASEFLVLASARCFNKSVTPSSRAPRIRRPKITARFDKVSR